MNLPTRLRAFGISKALNYLEWDPDTNLPKLIDRLDKYMGERLASPYRELFHRTMSDPGNNWHHFIRDMYTDIDSRALKKIFESFMIHAELIDWPSRNTAGELRNGRAPWAAVVDPSPPCGMDYHDCGTSICGVQPHMEPDNPDEEIKVRKERDCHLFIFSGDDPLAREQETIALCNKHTDCVFTIFTPPRFTTGELHADLLRVCNLSPTTQVDEDDAGATRVTALLRQYKLPFGVACRCIAGSVGQAVTELYYSWVIATGAKFRWFFACPTYRPERPASPE